MKATFTPGPWRAIDHDEDYVSITDQSQGYGICVCNQSSSPDFKANANLIAAAPELLEALVMVQEMLISGELVRDISQDAGADFAKRMIEFVPKLNKIMSAIAKARGKS